MYSIDHARCSGCGVCLDKCPSGAIYLVDGKAVVDQERCTECGICESVCPQDAIQVRSETVIAESVSPPGPRTRTAITSTLKPAATAIGTSLLSVGLVKLREFLATQTQGLCRPTGGRVSRRSSEGRGLRRGHRSRRRGGW